MHILVIDDNSAVRKALRDTLEAEDQWQVSEANDGRLGVEKAQQVHPDLVVLDLSMPVMNGLQAARELKRLQPSVPLLMFSNFETARLKSEAEAVGIDAIVSKSESVQVLLASIHDLLNKSAA